jgi:hypothetical protein
LNIKFFKFKTRKDVLYSFSIWYRVKENAYRIFKLKIKYIMVYKYKAFLNNFSPPLMPTIKKTSSFNSPHADLIKSKRVVKLLFKV